MITRNLLASTLLCSSLLMTGCAEQNSGEPAEKPLRPVRVIEVAPSNTSFGKEFIAVADAAQKADLAFKVAGKLVQFPVNQGDQVKKGQVLARLDDSDFQIQFREAKSSFDKARSDLNRGNKLFKTNTISKADIDQLKAQFNSAKAQLDTAKNNLDYTRLTAPFNGIIARKYTENFQEVNAKEAIIALHDVSRINLKIDIPESIMINAREAPPRITARFDALEGQSFDLKFEEVATQPDEITKTYEVTLSMPAPEGYNILPGMTARVRASRAESELAQAKIFLPAKVVLQDSAGNFVYTVRDNKDGSATVVKTQVDAGDISQLGIEILSGVSTGDLVLSAGMSKVSDGMKVRF